ncbi:hypothetical protein HPB50_005647 [Hyalomma asiaticum]|uniref:Uncharacterized protein n=1 Tax=Hyalomma asiaticum TaxID=266040 RepID=A0ACB7SCI3_HYAAI|nr:hypothetical protein HPB50_005647 [Hyalomma asiaticum]
MKARRIVFTTLWLSSIFGCSVEKCLEEYKQQRPTHTACLPPNKECTIRTKNVSKAEKHLILKTHNQYRSMVAMGKLASFSTATNMRELLWDDEVASVAQAKADQCTNARGKLDHDKAADRFTTKFKSVGQNLAFRRSSASFKGPDWPGQIKAWFDEYYHYPPEAVKSFHPPGGEPTGHFTQVVWATTGYVGCGYVDYTVAGVKEMPYMQLYVCNYASAGNVLTLPVYQAGDVCSACPEGTACVKDTGLCSPPKDTEALDEEEDANPPDPHKHRDDGQKEASKSSRKNDARMTFQSTWCVVAGAFAAACGPIFTWGAFLT